MTADTLNGHAAKRRTIEKVRGIDELAALAAEARRDGKTVVLCHGVFDLLHVGHIRHINAARRAGDVLVVTTTGDKYVAKGPGRPVFSEELRAEMLAALENIDWVGINQDFSAETLLERLRPDVYAKGSDYADADKDVTGKIRLEREIVERHGGRVLLTDDDVYSSSSLINRHINVFDPEIRSFLDHILDGDPTQVFDLIESVRDYRAVVVGDAIIDEYQYVSPMGKASKENIITTLYESTEVFAGGAFAAANHLANFCREVDLVTAIGAADDQDYLDLARRTLKPNVRLHPVIVAGRPTTRKTRFVESGNVRKLFEIYTMDDTPLAGQEAAAVTALIDDLVTGADVVVATDFGHGLIGPKAIDSLVSRSRFLAINAQSNSGNQGFNLITKYPRGDYICIDAPEARTAMADKHGDIRRIVGQALPERMGCRKVIVTHGANGCYFSSGDGLAHHVPALTKSVVDSVGAGDAFLSVTAPLVAAGGKMEHVALIGNAAGAIKVGVVGHRSSVEKLPLIRFLTTLLK